jgi:hypothetical protein
VLCSAMPTHWNSLRNSQRNKLTRRLVMDQYSCSQAPGTPSATTERTRIMDITVNFTLSGSTLKGLVCRHRDGTLVMQTGFAKMPSTKLHMIEVLKNINAKAIQLFKYLVIVSTITTMALEISSELSLDRCRTASPSHFG